MMKQAGYKTFWITNQQTMTARNTMLTVFSRQTDKQYYMNQQRTQSAREIRHQRAEAVPGCAE
ncbi:inner membrane protein [Escherichia coli]|uniref:Inner membrane protein n=1 Tax=Escherichia coli TaxID=562 RepID=A0A376L3N5_ECOLX|nr:inner membrane protein [Escherichia coli]